MKKAICLTILLIMAFVSTVPYAIADEKKSFEVTVTGFSILYNMCMEALYQPPNVSREWIDDNNAMIHLTETSFCTVTTMKKSDYSDITEVLFTAVPQKESDMLSVRCSMVSAIYALDSDLGLEFIADLVTEILPEKGEYISPYCKYSYEQMENVYMILIVPR